MVVTLLEITFVVLINVPAHIPEVCITCQYLLLFLAYIFTVGKKTYKYTFSMVKNTAPSLNVCHISQWSRMLREMLKYYGLYIQQILNKELLLWDMVKKHVHVKKRDNTHNWHHIYFGKRWKNTVKQQLLTIN